MTDSRMPDLSAVASPPRRDLDYRTIDVGQSPVDAGEQAVVYEAAVSGDAPPDRVALKEPSDDHGTVTGDVVDAFLDEASTWAMLDRHERETPRWADSEHVVGIVDTGTELPWIAMEYMDGGSLADRLDGTDGLPLDEALWIGECVCRGIELAHSYGVAHLDIKPANVLFRETGADRWDVPKLADWGLARSLSERDETVGGFSVNYAAPEQFEPDEFGEPDMLTDVYQTGAVVYALLTGRPPYGGSQLNILNDTVSEESPAPPSNHRDDVPPAVDALVSIALETNKRDRYDAIQIFRQALNAARTGQPLPPTVADRVPDDDPSRGATVEAGDSDGDESSDAESDSSESIDPQTEEPLRERGASEREAGDDSAASEVDDERTVRERDEADHTDQMEEVAGVGKSAETDSEGEGEETSERADSTAADQFDPTTYPEADPRDLAAAIQAMESGDPEAPLSEAIEALDDRSLATAVASVSRSTD